MLSTFWFVTALNLIPVLPSETLDYARSDNSSELDVSLWKAYSDTAVFDWYITLQEKDRMKRCDLTYGETEGSNSTFLVENFLPIHRSFNLHPLRENTSYWFAMSCKDLQDGEHASQKIFFHTEISEEPRVGARFSHIKQHLDSDGSDFRSKIIFSLKPKNKISPHSILGAGCALVGLVILTITSVLILRKYSKFRAEQDELWEQGYGLDDSCSELPSPQLDTVSLYCQQQLFLEMEKQQTSTLSLQTCETLDLPDLPDPFEEEHKLIT